MSKYSRPFYFPKLIDNFPNKRRIAEYPDSGIEEIKYMLMLVWLIIGIAVAVMMGSFIARQGSGPPVLWNLIAGAVGAFIGGYVSMLIGPMLTGPGPEFIVSFLGAAIVAAAAVMLVKMIKK